MTIDQTLQEKAVMQEISYRMKQYRISAAFTQEELSDRSMVSISTVRRFEGGEDISFSNLIKLLKALGLENNLELLVPDPEKRPSYHIDSVKMPKRVRKRPEKESGWKWGDET